MSLISDIQKALEEWSVWKRLSALPGRMDAIEARLAALESKPRKATGKECPSCGAYAYRVTQTAPLAGGLGELGAVRRTHTCEECHFTETTVAS